VAEKPRFLGCKGDNQHLQMDRPPKTTKDKKRVGLSQGFDHCGSTRKAAIYVGQLQPMLHPFLRIRLAS
jgi:hypothetical protein